MGFQLQVRDRAAAARHQLLEALALGTGLRNLVSWV